MSPVGGEFMHNGCQSPEALRIHDLAFSASRPADGLCKQTRRAYADPAVVVSGLGSRMAHAFAHIHHLTARGLGDASSGVSDGRTRPPDAEVGASTAGTSSSAAALDSFPGPGPAETSPGRQARSGDTSGSGCSRRAAPVNPRSASVRLQSPASRSAGRRCCSAARRSSLASRSCRS